MATTHPEFNENTEGLEVTKAFADGVRGKTAIVTGVNRDGIGFSTARALASQHPARVILAGRNPSKLQECIDLLKAEYPGVDYRPLKIDLSSQKSVRAAASELLSWSDVPKVNIIINSAGIMGLPERTLSEDGIEMHLATNHIGHWLFTCSIMPKLIKAAQENPNGATRIVNVSSGSPTVARSMRWSDINFDTKNRDLPEIEQPPYDFVRAWGYKDVEDKPYVGLLGYNQSKVANLLFAVGANQRLYEKYGILSFTVHPGVIGTELGRNFEPEILEAIGKMQESGVYTRKTLGAGSSTSLVAALDPKLTAGQKKGEQDNYGVFLADCQISDKALPLTQSNAEADKLWHLSEELAKETFEW